MPHYLIGPDRPRPDLPISAIERKLRECSFDFRPVLDQAWIANSDRPKGELERLFLAEQLTIREIG